MIARGRPLDEVLAALAQFIEAQCPSAAATIRLSIENRPTTRGARRTPVEARVALSTPITSRTGDSLGSVEIYLLDGSQPLDSIRTVVDTAAHLAAVAVDHWLNERRLLHSNEALSLLVSRAPIAVITVDGNRIITGWNPAAQKIFGWTSAEVIGQQSTRIMIGEDHREEHEKLWSQITEGQTLEGIEVTRRRKDGRMIEIACWAAPIRSHDDRIVGAISFIADVTEQKKLKDQLLRSARLESIGRLAGGVAHDFNNLLAVISGYSESMLRRTDASDPLRNHIEEIYRAASRGASLTRQLLAFGRRQRIVFQKIDLSQAVHSAYAMLRRVISDKIEIEVFAREPVFIVADAGQIEQVLVNLSINARDAMPQGGKLKIETSTVTIRRAVEGQPKPGRYAKLAVQDTGIGMDAQTCGHIFEPFFSTKHESAGGTGLGLSIVYGIVQQSTGTINVRSEPGAGTCFDVLIPLAEAGA
jgi:PAS domain S-box-containing protein